MKGKFGIEMFTGSDILSDYLRFIAKFKHFFSRFNGFKQLNHYNLSYVSLILLNLMLPKFRIKKKWIEIFR